MADWHIMEVASDGNYVQVVYHLPVPSGTNQAGMTYSQALVYSRDLVNFESVLPVALLGSGEETALQAGTLYEHVETYHGTPSETPAEKQAAIDARWTALSSIVDSRIQIELAYYGYEHDVS